MCLAKRGALKDIMHNNSNRRTKTFPTHRADEAHALREAPFLLPRIEYRRMVAEILG